MESLKVIDWYKKGNIVRFFLGDNDCKDYWGDDWNDRPYEHNAGLVYPEYVKATFDVAFQFDTLIAEPYLNVSNSQFSKEDMKNGIIPFLCVLPAESLKHAQEEIKIHGVGHYLDFINSEFTVPIYMNDRLGQMDDGGGLMVFPHNDKSVDSYNFNGSFNMLFNV